MIKTLLQPFHRLNSSIQDAIGRPYHAFLGIVLVYEIVHRVHDLAHENWSTGHLVQEAMAIAFTLLLLIGQLSELHERLVRRQR